MSEGDQVKELYIAQEKLNCLNFTMSVEGMGEELLHVKNNFLVS